jgi:hypothetical protein
MSMEEYKKLKILSIYEAYQHHSKSGGLVARNRGYPLNDLKSCVARWTSAMVLKSAEEAF